MGGYAVDDERSLEERQVVSLQYLLSSVILSLRAAISKRFFLSLLPKMPVGRSSGSFTSFPSTGALLYLCAQYSTLLLPDILRNLCVKEDKTHHSI